MQIPHGYTWREVMTAIAVIAVVAVFVTAAMGPEQKLKEVRDLVRQEHVRDLMEGLLQLRAESPTVFSSIIQTVEGNQTMIGSAYECQGSFGPRCDDAILSDDCLDADAVGLTDFLEDIPVDPLSRFAPRQTGYYLYAENGTLEVGACHPQTRERIILEAHLED